jgi:dTDP-4-amino-4,6-dideoxygalactose transaminase
MTHANRPLWKNLPRMLSRPKTNPFPGVIGTFMARDALSAAATSIGLDPNEIVLLPAFLCKEVLKPFVGRSRVQFYDVNEDLAVDPATIRAAFEKNRVRLVVIINYFGFLQPYRREIETLCSEYGTVLLEDCAHSLLTEGSGQTGAFSVFSFRKTLPVADGGGLRLRNPSDSLPIQFHPRLYSNVLSALALAKALLSFRSERFSRAGMTTAPSAQPAQSPTAPSRRVLPISTFAFNGIGHLSFDDIIQRRRRDYEFWQETASRFGLFRPVFPALEPGVCPLGFAATAVDRDVVKSRLEGHGVDVKIHWRLPPGVGEGHRTSERLSQQIMTLPVYPELDPDTRNRLRDALAVAR